MISSKNYYCVIWESYIIQSIQKQANLYIQVRNCCIITLTNLPLQVKKTEEKKKVSPQTHTAEPGDGYVKELKDSTCKALILIVCSPINVPEKLIKLIWEGAVRKFHLPEVLSSKTLQTNLFFISSSNQCT